MREHTGYARVLRMQRKTQQRNARCAREFAPDREARVQPARRVPRAVTEIRRSLEMPVRQVMDAAAGGHVIESIEALGERRAGRVAHEPCRRDEAVQRPPVRVKHRDASRNARGRIVGRKGRELAFRARHEPPPDEVARRTRRRRLVEMKQAMQDELVAAGKPRIHRAHERGIAADRSAMMIIRDDQKRERAHAGGVEPLEKLPALTPRRRRYVVHGNDRGAAGSVRGLHSVVRALHNAAREPPP